ncbi:Transmembrane protein OS=Streptomyces tendae OX=1932 GN=GUR47_21270 PE=4 SV=1 [Streptomyces tendae]
MHMNSVPQHLSNEDRPDYERILDEALRSAPHRPELAAVGQRLNSEQLRTMALNATALITAAATTEYQHYVKVREELRHPAPSGPSSATRESGSEEQGTGAGGLAATMGEMAEATGAGAVAVVAVLAPVLAGTAAAIFLLVGYLLKMLDPGQTFAQTMLTTGWVFGAVTAVAILVAAVGLLLTALRNRPSAESGFYDARDEEVARARDAWHEALLERGILPFLRDALSEPGTAALHRTGPATPSGGRMPHLGYGRPGFTSPDGGPDAGPRPSYSSPDYSSPDFGGPEHRPE